MAWLCRVKAIPDGGQSSFRHGAKQGTAACHKWVMGYDSTITADPGGAAENCEAWLSVLFRAEGTVATGADTVPVWRSGARAGWRPRGMATVSMFYTVTRGTAI